MDHHPSPPPDAYERRKSRVGIRMTLLYSIVYGGFVALSVFRPDRMGVRAVLGLNLAVAYGIGLIVVAIVFALVYNHICRVPSAPAAARTPADRRPRGEERP